jgi:hypothetical protein
LEIVISQDTKKREKKMKINQIEKEGGRSRTHRTPERKKKNIDELKTTRHKKKKKMRKRPYISSALSLFFLLLILLACRTRRLSAITSHNPLAMVWK